MKSKELFLVSPNVALINSLEEILEIFKLICMISKKNQVLKIFRVINIQIIRGDIVKK
jgi:hypothetical protein